MGHRIFIIIVKVIIILTFLFFSFHFVSPLSPPPQIEGKWHTWIDYEKFHQLIAKGEPFGALDYTAPTPEWSVFGHSQRGFDPVDARHYRKGKKKEDGEEKEVEGSTTKDLEF